MQQLLMYLHGPRQKNTPIRVYVMTILSALNSGQPQKPSQYVEVLQASKNACEELCTVLIEASSDPLLENTSMPRLYTKQEVEEWLQENKWDMWVILENNTPVGYIGIHSLDLTEEVEKYKDYMEIDYYILPPHRGKRLISQAWNKLKNNLSSGTKFVAEVWEDNKASIIFCERENWTYVGRFHWADAHNPNCEGYCHRYTYHIQ